MTAALHDAAGVSPRFAIGLRGRLVGIVAFVLVVLFAACAAIAVIRSERALLEVDEGRARASTRQLASQIAYGTLARSEPLVAPVLDAFLRDPAVMRLEIVDDSGNAFISRRGQAQVGPPLVVSTPIETQAQAPGDIDDELSDFGIETAPARRVGTLVATFSRAAAKDVEGRLTREFVLVFLALGGLGLIVVLWIANTVVRRVRALARGASAFAAGDHGVVVDEGGSDELSGLSRDFNAMTRALNGQREQLDHAAGALAERESLAAIGRATAVIAHELKNPLGIVLGASRILESEKKSPEAKAKAARIISEEVRRLDDTLKGLLDFARPRPVQKSHVDVGACARDAARRATLPGGPAEDATVDVVTPSDAPILAAADEQQLSQTLWNLIQNAVQANASVVTLRIEPPSDEEARVVITIEDDGDGISDAVVPNLFSPFVTTKQRGAGLGLAGARRMMRSVGGDLWLASASGPLKGAVFRLALLVPHVTPRFGATTPPPDSGANP